MNPNEDFDIRLIELVKQYPELYTYKGYKDEDMQNKAWGKIGARLRKDNSACMKRWKSIAQSHKRYLRSRAMFGAKVTPYKYNKHLGFLRSHLNVKGNTAPVMRDNAMVDENLQETNSNNDNMMTYLVNKQVAIGSRELQRSGRAEEVRETKYTDYREASICSSGSTSENQKTKLDLFLSRAAPTLKSLSPYEQAEAKGKLFQIVNKYEMMMLKPLIDN